jgi:asparagine synthase (glutamine-hydrolysing)
VPGLVGLISDDVRDGQLLDRMVNSIRHEQWYKIDRYINPPFNIARVHLGIFNPEPQPIFNEDKTLCIFMDGKVYGYDDEKKRLQSNHHFVSNNDPEFCLHLYEELGTESFKKLNGNFVLLICDLREKKAILANDRNCLRNVYYAEHNGTLLFAPEAKAILQDRTFKRGLDVEALAMSLAYGEFWDDRTLFERMHFLPPASILTFSKGQVSRTRYWDLCYQPDYGLSDGVIVEQLIEATRRAVAIRMKDKLRYGISLSGGLDSRVVLAAVDSEKRKSVTTLTYGPFDCDEIIIAEKVAKKCGTVQRSVEITPQMILKNAEQEVWLSDGRNSIHVSCFHPVYEQIKGDVDVVFDGLEFGAMAGGSSLTEQRVQGESKEELLYDIRRDRRLLGDDELLRLFSPRYHGLVKEAPLKAFEMQYTKITNTDPKTAFDEFFWRTHLVYWSTWHVYMMDLVEMSFPTVDNDLVAAIYRIPPEKRLNHRIYRLFLKQLSPDLATIPYNRTMLPPSWPLVFWDAGRAYRFGKQRLAERVYRASKGKVYIRNKRRYIDEVGWMRVNADWKSYFRALLLASNSALREYLDQDYIRCLIEQHEEGTCDNSAKILRLATFELFLRQFQMR